MTEKEKSYAEMLYQPGDPELVADREITVRKLTEYNGIDPLDREARDRAIRGILGKAGKNCVVEQRCSAPMAIIPRWGTTFS